MDEDLDEEDVDEGDWLSFGLRWTGDDDPAFEDQDGDDLTFSARGDSAGGCGCRLNAETGRMTNKEEMLPERGVYTVTVMATDEADENGDTNTAVTSFKLAVAISDSGDEDNDRPISATSRI